MNDTKRIIQFLRFTLMNKLLLLSAILAILSSCDGIDFENEQTFSGTLQYVFHAPDTTAYNNTETYDICFKMDANYFARILDNGRKGCFGNVAKSNNSITFTGDDCACWCDCSPLVDCMGEMMFGTFSIEEETSTSLRLRYYEPISVSQAGTHYLEKIMELKVEAN